MGCAWLDQKHGYLYQEKEQETKLDVKLHGHIIITLPECSRKSRAWKNTFNDFENGLFTQQPVAKGQRRPAAKRLAIVWTAVKWTSAGTSRHHWSCNILFPSKRTGKVWMCVKNPARNWFFRLISRLPKCFRNKPTLKKRTGWAFLIRILKSSVQSLFVPKKLRHRGSSQKHTTIPLSGAAIRDKFTTVKIMQLYPR